MMSAPFMPIVFMVLLLALLTVQLLRGPRAGQGAGPKSTLARDGGQGGVGFLIPKTQHAEVAALRAGQKKA